MKWMTIFQIDGRRFAESWMDLLPELDLNSPPIQSKVVLGRNVRDNAQAALAAADDQHLVEPWTYRMEQAVFDEAFRLHIVISSHSPKN